MTLGKIIIHHVIIAKRCTSSSRKECPWFVGGMLLLIFFVSTNTHAQIRIHNSSTIAAKGQFTINTSLTNGSANANFNEAKITIAGSNKQISTNQETVVANLVINNTGVTTVQGSWKITNALSLTKGILQVGSEARLIYLGDKTVEGSTTSYVEGYFTQSGGGRKFFPIGGGGYYLPAILLNLPTSTTETGMRVIVGDAALQLPAEISTTVSTHYWELKSAVAAPVSLSLNHSGTGSLKNFVVLQASTIQNLGNILEGSTGNNFITTNEAVTQTILVIAKRPEFTLIIHDMITPFVKDEINDKLVIENIEQTTSNKVVLLDRWGVKVNEWKNYSSEVTYDFSSLSPGNYICLVEYTSPSGNHETQKGIITVLSTK